MTFRRLLTTIASASIFLAATANTPPTGLDSASSVSKVELDASKAKLKYSTEIMVFEDNRLPIDLELFNYHISKLEFEIPMVYNHHVKHQIDYFGTSWQRILKKMVTKSQYYFPIYEEILDKNNMPLELKYLSIIESALNPFARSRAGAVGPWQFMPATGRYLSLDANYTIDERRDLEKSTQAACTYLNQLYTQFGDWHVALAAYNCGPGNVRKAIRYSGKTDFWGMYNYLPRETRNYVPKFIAMAYMMNYYHTFGITALPIDELNLDTRKVYCNKEMRFSIIAQELEMSKEELMQLNPELKTAELPHSPEGYVLNLPPQKVALYEEKVKTIQEQSIELTKLDNQKKIVYHRVRKGECLPIIARRYGCSVYEIKKWNHLRGSIIHPNQRLRIEI
jgi:membrane-bound lytic murein transglycosylase D